MWIKVTLQFKQKCLEVSNRNMNLFNIKYTSTSTKKKRVWRQKYLSYFAMEMVKDTRRPHPLRQTDVNQHNRNILRRLQVRIHGGFILCCFPWLLNINKLNSVMQSWEVAPVQPSLIWLLHVCFFLIQKLFYKETTYWLNRKMSLFSLIARKSIKVKLCHSDETECWLCSQKCVKSPQTPLFLNVITTQNWFGSIIHSSC